MEKDHLYQQIADTIRNDILNGKIKPGEKLPSVRKLTATWDCTPGTIQRAYKNLSEQGLVVSRAGQGTHVVQKPNLQQANFLRKASLIHKAEAFLLEALNAGYSQAEIEQSIRLALDHWRVIQQEPITRHENTIRFSGSNDLAVSWIAANFDRIVPDSELTLQFGGSLSGLIALSEHRAELAGCHLWDTELEEYNSTYIKRILPGEKIGLVTLAERRMGLIVPPGNPLNCKDLEDLYHPDIVFINRQSGSGTRVWLEANLQKKNCIPENIRGYTHEKNTHNDVARAVADGEGNVGLGLQAAAQIYHLDFVPLTSEVYELAFRANSLENPYFRQLIDWLSTSAAKTAIQTLHGYNTNQSGAIRWVE